MRIAEHAEWAFLIIFLFCRPAFTETTPTVLNWNFLMKIILVDAFSQC